MDADTDKGETSSRRSARALRVVAGNPLTSGFVVAIGVILAVALAWAMTSLATVLMSIVLGLFLALGLDPAVKMLEARGLRRGWGVAIVVVALLALVVLIAVLVVPQVIGQFVAAVRDAPAAIDRFLGSEWAAALRDEHGIDLQAAIDDALASVASITSLLAVSGGLLRVGFGALGAVSSSVIVVVLTVYFITSLDAMKRALGGLIPAYRRDMAMGLVNQITASVGGVVSGGITVAAANAVVVFVLQLVIGSPISLVLAVTAFFITIVPLVGSLIFLVIGTAAALLVSPLAAVVFGVLYLGYIQVEAYYLTPRVMGKAVSVPGVLVIIGAMVGATLVGLLGALVAIPVTASILIIIREVIVPRQNARTTPPIVQ